MCFEVNIEPICDEIIHLCNNHSLNRLELVDDLNLNSEGDDMNYKK